MIKWVETRDWENALYAVVPKRKFQGRHGHDKMAVGCTMEDGGDEESLGDGVDMENTSANLK